MGGIWIGNQPKVKNKDLTPHLTLDVKGVYGKVVRISLKDIDRKRVFLAFRINGEPLPQKHGFPLRLVYEDAYGYDWVKYVEEIVIS